MTTTPALPALEPLRVLETQQGFFTTAQARALGYDEAAIRRALRGRDWVRLRRGYFVHADTWADLDAAGRHRARAHAVLDSLGPSVALSHVSGVIEHGLATWDLDLSRVHVTRLDSGVGRVEGDVVHHQGRWVDGDVVEVAGRRVLRAERCVLEAASRTSLGPGLVMADSLLHLGKADQEQLARQFARMQRWPFVRGLHLVVRLADGRSESPGESLGRHLFWAANLPAPEPQFAVRTSSGRVVGRSDWGWPEHRLLGEFDGKVKYGRLLKAGETPGDAVFREKQREDEMRGESGYGMVRLVWDDLMHPVRTADRVRHQLVRYARSS